jgi:hypothetical protein
MSGPENGEAYTLSSLEAMENAMKGAVNRILLASNPMITSLTGLGGVNRVNRLESGTDGLSITDMDGLSSLEGLEGLTYAGSVRIGFNSSLASLEGLEGLAVVGQLQIIDNDSLLSLEGLNGLESAGGCFSCVAVTIRDNDALESLSGLENLTQITYGIYTDTGLEIEGNPDLRSCSCGLSGLISGDPPTFSGVDDDVVISNNDPQGLCTSPEVVLATPCEPVANEDESTVPQVLQLEAYPNPLTEAVTLSYALPEAGPVRLAVYDLLGREVAVLADGMQPMGRHEARLDGLAAGVYVVRMEAGDGEELLTRRVTVVN